jgi:RHH-type transcriptional regulator, rel operon repressor / antitoxin RelB
MTQKNKNNAPDTTTMTLRLSKKLEARLGKLAANTNRTKSFHAAEAIAEYIAGNEWQIAGITKAIRSADVGRTVPHTKVKAWLRTLGTGKELPRPQH